jgi:hypothetical protein
VLRAAHFARSPSRVVITHRFESYLAALCLSALGMGASGSAPTYTLVVGSRSQLGALAGVPANLAYQPISGTIGDLNGDGAPDIVVGINGGPPAVYFNNGTANPFLNVSGVFVATPQGPAQPGISWGAVVIGDIDGDGHPDLVIGGFNAPNEIYLNDGSPTPFNGVTGIAIGTQDISYIPAIGDINGDGFPDLAVANTNHAQSRLYLTHGAPLTAETTPPSRSAPTWGTVGIPRSPMSTATGSRISF